MVPTRSAEKQISAKGLLLHPNGPASGQHFHADCLQGQNESQLSSEGLPQPVMGQASLVMDIFQ